MRKSHRWVVSCAALALAAGIFWSGCGSDDHHGNDFATITGNIASVNPAQARRDDTHRRLIARLDDLLVADAIAQTTCPAKHVLICATNGRDPIFCEPVSSSDCRFTITIDTLGDFSGGGVSFVDDANQNGTADQGELFGVLTNQLVPLCNGTVATLNDVTVNFPTLTATAASVVKDPDTCAGTPTATARATARPTATPGSTSTPHATSTPNPTGTAVAAFTQTAAAKTATATSTPYGSGASLQAAPSRWLALLSGVGAVGLLVPRRRRRR